MFSIWLVVLTVSCCGIAASNVSEAFIENKIVPNIIKNAPEDLIHVKYSRVEINLGNRVHPFQTLTKPDVTFNAKDDELHTIVFFGPDLPPDITPPYTQFLHWMIVNIPGTSLKEGKTVSTYFPPTPYPGGFNYIFLLFKQSESIDAKKLEYLSVIFNRPHFDIIGFQEKHNLTGPVAGNFMKEVYLPPYSK
ncbi:unnamed protein product, partial [Brenthis ino]